MHFLSSGTLVGTITKTRTLTKAGAGYFQQTVSFSLVSRVAEEAMDIVNEKTAPNVTGQSKCVQVILISV